MKFWISKMWESRLLSAALIAMGLATQPLAAQTFSDELWEAKHAEERVQSAAENFRGKFSEAVCSR